MMIDLKTFNLIYVRKKDGRKFLVKNVTKYDYRVIDTVTGEVFNLSQYQLRTSYSPAKKVNKVNKKKRRFMNFGKKRVA